MTIIIDENSVLNRLPVELDGYTLLILDSIRITLQMIQIYFKKERLSAEKTKKGT